MRRIATLLISTMLSGAPAFLPALAGENAGAPPQKPDVVAASKANKAKHKSSSTRVITNADVKRSKGKLIQKPAAPAAAASAPARKQSTLQEDDARYRARIAATEQLAASEKKVAGLEKDLETIEQRYYEENDPNYRDSVIQKRFAQARRQLEDARRELADARDALQAAGGARP